MSGSPSFAVEKEVPPSPPSSHLNLPSISGLSPPPLLPAVETIQEPSASLILPSVRLLPSLPIELKKEILRFCDPATLASTSKVSLAFLELSSPLLYTDITLKGIAGLYRLFCLSDPDERQPSLEPYLDLFQIKFLTLVVDLKDKQIYEAVEIEDRRIRSQVFEHRLVVPSLLSRNGSADSFFKSIKHLTLQVVQQEPPSKSPFQFRALLAFFNPTHVVLQGISSSPSLEDAFVQLDLPSMLWWSSLKSLTFVNSGPRTYLHNSLLRACEQKVVVVHDLLECSRYKQQLYSSSSLAHALVNLMGEGPGLDESLALLTSPSLEKVVFRVQDRDQLENLERRITRSWSIHVVALEKQMRWAGLIELEEVDSGARRFLSLRSTEVTGSP